MIRSDAPPSPSIQVMDPRSPLKFLDYGSFAPSYRFRGLAASSHRPGRFRFLSLPLSSLDAWPRDAFRIAPHLAALLPLPESVSLPTSSVLRSCYRRWAYLYRKNAPFALSKYIRLPFSKKTVSRANSFRAKRIKVLRRNELRVTEKHNTISQHRPKRALRRMSAPKSFFP